MNAIAPGEYETHDARAWILDGRRLVQVRFRSTRDPMNRCWGLWDFDTSEPTFVAGMFRAGVTIHQAAAHLGLDSRGAPALVGDTGGAEVLSGQQPPTGIINELHPPAGGRDGEYWGS